LSEHLAPLPEPLACLLSPGPVEAPAAVAALGARALLDLAPLGPEERTPWPTWLAPHQVPAAERLRALLVRWGGALLADAPGLGTATPVHNRVGDLCHLLRLFLRDHALTALGVPSLRCVARGERDVDPAALRAAAARLCVSRSRERARTGWTAGPVALSFPARSGGAVARIGAAPDALLERLVAGIGQLDCGGEAAGLFRLLLLSQLASSLPAF